MKRPPADTKDKPLVDLHPSEWTHEKKREPIFGPGGKPFVVLFLLSFPVSALATWLVTGQFPYWVKPVLELLASPFL